MKCPSPECLKRGISDEQRAEASYVALYIPGPVTLEEKWEGVRQDGNQGWSSGSQSIGGDSGVSVRGCRSL